MKFFLYAIQIRRLDPHLHKLHGCCYSAVKQFEQSTKFFTSKIFTYVLYEQLSTAEI